MILPQGTDSGPQIQQKKLTMNTFNQYIKQLLMQHDCVIVPGLGGFITYRQEAYIKNGLIFPSTKNIRFNSLLNYNDGLLCEMYMTNSHIPYPEALKAIEQTVNLIQCTLQQNQTCQLDAIGTLHLHNDNSISLSCNDASFLPCNYGLCPIPLYETKHRHTTNNAETIVLNIPGRIQRTLRYAAAVIIVTAISLLLPSPHPDNAHYATFTFDPLHNISDIHSTLERIPEHTPEKKDSTATLAAAQSGNEYSADNEYVALRQELPSETTQQAPTPNKYHLIVASLKNRRQAEKYISEQKQYKQQTLSIIEEGGKYRVTAMSFSKYAEAMEYADSIRNTSGGKHAWIMCAKR